MGVQERRERQKETLRQEILDAAREMFVQEGYENVSMRKIADRIEYSPTTIYLHFKDKAELFQCICDETFAKLARKLETLRHKSGTDPLVFLREGMRAYVEIGLKHPNHYTVAFIFNPGVSEDYPYEGSIGEKAFNYLRMAVAHCVEQGKLRSVNVDATAQALWAAIHGVTSLLIVHKDFPFVPKARLVDQVIDTMIEGLRA